MLKKSRRVKALFMALSIFLCNSIPVHANVVTDNEKAAVETRCKVLQENIIQKKSGEFGMFSRLKALTEYQMYVLFIHKNYLGFSKEEITGYVDNLRRYVKDFNQSYGKKSTENSIRKLNLKNVPKSGDPEKAIQENLCEVIPKYLREYLESVQKDVDKNKTDSSQETAMENHETAIRMCFDILECYDRTITELTNQSAQSANGSEKKLFVIDGTRNNSKIIDTLDDMKEKYADILEYGEKISSLYKGDSKIGEFDTGKPPLEIFSNAVIDDDGGISFDGEPGLSSSYLALLAASSVYRPFESYVGAEEFLAAISYLCGDVKTASDLCSVYSSTKDFRKPLYKRKLNSAGEPTGVATIVTLQQFLDDITSGDSFALVSIDGTFKLDPDTQTWVYSTEKEGQPQAQPATEAETEQETDNSLDNVPSVDIDSADSADSREQHRHYQNKTVATGVNDPSNGNFPESESEGTETEGETTEVKPGSDSDASNYDTAYRRSSAETTIDAYEEITDISKMSDPLLVAGIGKARAVDNMTTAILSNVIQNLGNLEKINDKKTRFLYVNTYGDIVLDDNLVVLPGIVNPVFWKEDAKYVPYTAALMNNYPSVLYKHSYFKMYSGADVGKFMFFGESESAQSTLTKNKVNYTGYSMYQTHTYNGFDEKEYTSLALDVDFDMSDGSGQSTRLLRTKTFLYDEGTGFSPGKSAPFVLMTNDAVNGNLVFPYSSDSDSGFQTAKVIVQNMYNKLAVDGKSREQRNQGKLHDNYIIENFIQRQLDGTSNPEAYSKNALLQYDNFVENTPDRIRNNVVNFADDILSYVGELDGIIGIKDTYSMELIGRFFNFLRENIVFIILLIAAFVVFCFIKNNNTIFHSILVGVMAAGAAYVFLIVIPVYLPYIYNSITNNVSQPLAFEALGMSLEKESANQGTKPLDGEVDLTSSTISLYRYPFYDLSDIREKLALADMTPVTGGDVYVFNEDSGLYLENTTVKISLADLMGTLQISGEYDTGHQGVYQLRSYKTSSSNMDYYTPYYQIVDGFIGRLNGLIEVYQIPRTTGAYIKGSQKDKFAVSCYLKSAPFLTPGVYGSTIDYQQEKMAGLSDEEIQVYVDQDKELEELLTQIYGNNDDWLGLASVIAMPSTEEGSAVRETLWARELQKQGYYTEDWQMDGERCAELVKYVNYVTKKFVYEIEDLTNDLSDDTLIKLISLRALLALNQHSSDALGKLYPLFVNYDDFRLGNVMSAVYAGDFHSFVTMDMDVAGYVAGKYGVFSLLFYVLTVVEISIFSLVVRFLFPFIYLSFGILFLYKLFSNRNLHPLIRGYFRFTVYVFGEFSLFCLALTAARYLREHFIGILFLFLAVTMLLWLLFRLIMSWFEDKANFGDSCYNVSIVDSFNRMKSRFVNRMHVNEVITGTGDVMDDVDYGYDGFGFQEYGPDAGVDDLYSRRNFDNYDESGRGGGL